MKRVIGRNVFMVDRFSSLDDVPKQVKSNPITLLRALDLMDRKRFSCFEASETPAIGAAFTRLFQGNYIEGIGGEYPWTNFRVTKKGKDAIKAEIGQS